MFAFRSASVRGVSAQFSSWRLRGQVAPGLELERDLVGLGVSHRSIDRRTRGFSFIRTGVDMRMSAGVGMSAADVVNGAL